VIQNIEIKNFKSLRHIDLKLGALNLFIGTNSSGKSNFLDALRVLQGIGYGFTFDEILNGKPRSASTEVWAPIRGGSAKATYTGLGPNDKSKERFVLFQIKIKTAAQEDLTYWIEFSAHPSFLQQEALTVGSDRIFEGRGLSEVNLPFSTFRYYKTAHRKPETAILEKSRSALPQFFLRQDTKELHKELIGRVITNLTNMQGIEPVPAVLREYSIPQSVRRMGEHGENFAALVKSIISDPAAKAGYLSWLQNLTPTEVDDVVILEGALGEPLFALKERNVEYPAPVLSDGTLRFAAIAAAFFQPDMPDLITIEEIENGIHPTRLRLLVELLKTQSLETGRQIIATTHSPVVLAWLNDEDYETTFFCKRDEKTGESIIKPLTELPHFIDAVKKQPLSELFAEGWLEGVL
jgi:energy-coupling factor transporter ATP-binding protein EcfA2